MDTLGSILVALGKGVDVVGPELSESCLAFLEVLALGDAFFGVLAFGDPWCFRLWSFFFLSFLPGGPLSSFFFLSTLFEDFGSTSSSE